MSNLITLTENDLRNLVREELEKMLEEDSGLLGNGYKWCDSGTKCSPKSNKTKWWKGSAIAKKAK